MQDAGTGGDATQGQGCSGDALCDNFDNLTAGRPSTAVTSPIPTPPAPPSANGSMWTPPTPFAPKSFALGWMSFSSQAMTAWFDDVAVSASRIGCQ